VDIVSQQVQLHNGRLERGRLGGQLRALLDHFHNYLDKTLDLWKSHGPLDLSSPFRDTTWSLLGEEAPKAFVCPNGEGSFIGLSVGYPLILFDLCTALLSNPDVFPEVGDVSVEAPWDAPPPPARFQAARQTHLESTDDLRTSGFWRIPNDPARRQFAMEMTLDALTFLLYHEVAHVFRGHLHVYRQPGGHQFLDEAAAEPAPPAALGFHQVGDVTLTGLELRQFFELDADAVAADILMYEKAPMDFPDKAGELDLVLGRVNRALAAVSVLFLMMAPPRRLAEYATRWYPHPLVRQQLAATVAVSSIMKLLKVSGPDGGLAELRGHLKPALVSIGRIGRTIMPLLWPDCKEEPAAVTASVDERRAFYDRLSRALFVDRSTLAPIDRPDAGTP